MLVEQFEGETAVNFIRQVQQSRRELHDNCRLHLWMTEPEVFCYVLFEDGRALCFALLSVATSGDDHPLPQGHSRTKCLNYIYTVEAQRNRGLASLLLSRIKADHEITAVCWNDISERIFYKTGYIIQEIDNGNAIYRYP